MSETHPKKFDLAVLRRVFRYAAPYKKKFYLSVTLAILLAVATPVRPLLVQWTVDEFIARSIARMVVIITLIQIGLILVETLMRFWFSFMTAWLGQSVVKRFTDLCV